jgi:hypothetical protein
MDDSRLRAWWWRRQGLDGSLRGRTAAEVLDRSGWARSVGGVGPYLTLFSRARIRREEADKAVARLEIHELPTARNCTYVVPASDFAIGLKVGQDFANGDMKTAAKLGVTEKEIAKLCAAVLNALEQGPLDPEGIRAATGNASRSLGEEGKKKGISTTLPLALTRLQAEGEIRRVPVNGRLDQQRYQYTLWKDNPLASFKDSMQDAFTQLARRFFRWAGPATAAEFQWFSGLGARAAREALEPLGLLEAESGGNRLLLPDDVEAFRTFEAPAGPQYALVAGLDAITSLRRDVKSLLDPSDYDRKVLNDKTEATAGRLVDLPNHAILDRGRVVGLWEYDPETQSIVYMTFGVKDKALDAVISETETYVREQLGDARHFSLDSPKSRASRIQWLRKAGGR